MSNFSDYEYYFYHDEDDDYYNENENENENKSDSESEINYECDCKKNDSFKIFCLIIGFISFILLCILIPLCLTMKNKCDILFLNNTSI